MSMPAADRHAWTEPAVEDLGGRVYRIPLPLPMDALRAVNVYAIADDEGVDLIDGGIALVQARERLTEGLREIGYELGDIRNFFVTHIHADHYSLALELRQTLHNLISLGEGERANIAAMHDMSRTGANLMFGGDLLHQLGADELAAKIAAVGRQERDRHPRFPVWDEPDRWLADGAQLDLRSRTLHALHTPGHTVGHVVFHDAASKTMFAGDHILPHITPSIGFEPARDRMALASFLTSLHRILALPDARLLPAHGPVTGSTHDRVNELLAHHDLRLAETRQAVQAGNATPYEVAQAIRWTRRQTPFGEMDPMNQFLATSETAAHLEVLAVRAEVTRHVSEDGVQHYQPVTGPAATDTAATGTAAD
jgi:glyoxylase-like metal-dependent hydrolase (beta-lactamase superfamily II)